MARDYIDRMAYSAMHRAAADLNQQGPLNGNYKGMVNGAPSIQASTHSKNSRPGGEQPTSTQQEGDQSSDGVFGAIKAKVFEHYTNFLGIPQFFRRKRTNSNKSDKGVEPEGPDTEEYEFVENIELAHMDGFIGFQKEVGKGHQFEAVNLEAATWCDFCGDFIWGVYKQCLRCKCK